MIAIPLGEAFPYKKEGVLILHFRSQKSGFGTLGYSASAGPQKAHKGPTKQDLVNRGVLFKISDEPPSPFYTESPWDGTLSSSEA